MPEFVRSGDAKLVQPSVLHDSQASPPSMKARDHRAIKRVVRPMLGFKFLRCAGILIAGIEIMHIIKKRQLVCPKAKASSAASQFYSLAF